MKIIISEDCGNSPKNLRVQNIHLMILQTKSDELEKELADDVVWTLYGEKTIRGKDEMLREVSTIREEDIEEFHLDHVLTHGKVGAANGKTVQYGKNSYYSNLFVFSGSGDRSKLKEMHSYVIFEE